MKQPELNRRLSSLDAAFLYLEKKECPLHIGSTSVFEGKITRRDLIKQIGERLHLVPRYLQKVVPDPFLIGHPTWETDDDFNIENHIFKVKQKKALSETDVIKLAGETLTTVMDRTKPLWEFYVVENYEGNRSAMIAKIHHCMVDGISGVDLIKILFDITPEIQPPPPKPETVKEEKPNREPLQQLFDSLIGGIQEGINRLTDMQMGLLHLGSTLANPQTVEALPHISGVLPAVLTPAPMLPFNGKCSGERRLAWSEFSFKEARAIRTTLGGSVNDVVLTLLSEAVARYCKFHEFPTKDKIVRFMVPVSLRQKEQQGALGNLISILPVEIPLDINDLPHRFKYVNQKTAVMKSAHLAEGLLTIASLFAILPAPVQSGIGAVADLPFPPFNMVATNVPGPQVPLYLAGRKMLAQYPYVPIGYGLGLGCAILSYNQTLYFGLSSDAQAMGDVEKFKEILDEVFADLKIVVEKLANQTASAVGAE
ncbi:MAG: wax ester/triacylglycerol synthase family O-acyltransferase [Pyrinomonadaceae bacterium]|nr:wax ester/triacylglycerol synthase family O-acyltransferase [Pyrinomonadaceae bacterium]